MESSPAQAIDIDFLPKEALIKYNQAILKLGRDAETITTLKPFHTFLAKAAVEIAKEAVQLGDQAFLNEDIESMETEEGRYAAFITFEWSGKIKELVLFSRNALVELQKAIVYTSTGKLNKTQTQAMVSDIKNKFESILISTSQQRDDFAIAFQGDPQKDKQIKEWRFLKNPWETYHTQIQTLQEQCEKLEQRTLEIEGAAKVFDQLSKQTKSISLDFSKYMKSKGVSANESIDFIKASFSGESEVKPGKIATNLQNLANELQKPRALKPAQEDIEQLTESLPGKLNMATGTQAGKLIYRELNLSSQTKSWMESEIFPVLYEIWEICEDIFRSHKMALMNICNRCLVVSSEMQEGKTPEFDAQEISQPLSAFVKKQSIEQKRLKELRSILSKRLEQEFSLENAYKNQTSFLPIPLQSSINQIKLGKNPIIVSARNWVSEKVETVQSWLSSIKKEEQLSEPEKFVRYIEERTPDQTRYQYAGIFLTKGFVGESFWVGREHTVKHVEELIHSWQKGYRGTVMVSGKRFCGKSMLGEFVANRYFKNKVIKLVPGSLLKFNGRSHQLTCDLQDALNFIKKHALREKSMIWIDDLALWQNKDTTLNHNVLALKKFMDTYSDRLFFVVAMSNWLKNHLDKVFEFSNSFQSNLNLDKMNTDEIREAILIRHGATHKLLVNEEGKELNSSQFKKLVERVTRLSENNIGESLIYWAAGVEELEGEHVRFLAPNYSFPNSVTQQNCLLLSTIMMDKCTNEYRLRKLFGPAFQHTHSSVLQQLLRSGIVKRQIDGSLEINESAVNDIGRQLDKLGYIQFYNK